jgi:uncharacterized protein
MKDIMKYRKFGKLDWKVSALGFGAMRLPLANTNPEKVDEPEAIRMIRYAIDHGVNYLDTAFPYHGGNSEKIVGKALKDGYQERMKLTTKLPARAIESAKDFDRFFDLQLERLEVKKLDFYLLHGLNALSWAKVRDLGIIKWAETQMGRGKFDHLGFSFHDQFPAFKEIIDGYDNWTSCQIQYNYMDVNNQAGRKGVEYAAGKGLAIIIMEPLRGGKLANPPEVVSKILAQTKTPRSPAQWALQWVWNQPEISVVLSGMSTMEQVVQNISTAEQSDPGILTEDEIKMVDRAREAYRGLIPIPCTGCRYCAPCPNGVDIPAIFQIYNESVMYNDSRMGKMKYSSEQMGLKPEKRADRCVECGQCAEACPQKILVSDWLKKVHAQLAAK